MAYPLFGIPVGPEVLLIIILSTLIIILSTLMIGGLVLYLIIR